MLSGLTPSVDKTQRLLNQLVDTLLNQAKALQEKGEYIKSLAAYTNALDAATRVNHAERITIHLRRAQLHVKLCQYNDAENDCKSAQKIQPGHPEILQTMKELHARSKQKFVDSYLKQSHDNLKLGEITSQDIKLATKALELTHEAFGSFGVAQLGETIELTSTSLKTYPCAVTYLLRGKTYYAQGEIKKALESYTEGLKLTQSAHLYFLRSNCYSDIGEHQKAKQDLLKGMTLDNKGVSLTEDNYLNILCTLHLCEKNDYHKSKKQEEQQYEYKETVETTELKQLTSEMVEDYDQVKITDSQFYYKRGMLHSLNRDYLTAIENYTYAIWMSLRNNHSTNQPTSFYIAARRKAHLWAGNLIKADEDHKLFFVHAKSPSTKPEMEPQTTPQQLFAVSNAFDLHIKRQSDDVYAFDCIEKANHDFSGKKYSTAFQYYLHGIYILQMSQLGKLDLTPELILLAQDSEKMKAYVASNTNEVIKKHIHTLLAAAEKMTPRPNRLEASQPNEAHIIMGLENSNEIMTKMINKAKDILDKGKILQDQNQLQSAVTLLDMAVKTGTESQHPLLPVARSLRGMGHYEMGNYAIALTDFTEIADEHSTAQDCFYRGMSFIAMGNRTQGKYDFLRCFSLDPEGKALIFKNKEVIQAWITNEENIETNNELTLAHQATASNGAANASCSPLLLIDFIPETPTGDSDVLSCNPYLSIATYFARSKAYKAQYGLQKALEDVSIAIWLCLTMNDRQPAHHLTELYSHRSKIYLDLDQQDKALQDLNKLYAKLDTLSQEEAKSLPWIDVDKIKKLPDYSAKHKDYKKWCKRYLAIEFAREAVQRAETHTQDTAICADFYRSALLSFAECYPNFVLSLDAKLFEQLQSGTRSTFIADLKDNSVAVEMLEKMKRITQTLLSNVDRVAAEKKTSFRISDPKITRTPTTNNKNPAAPEIEMQAAAASVALSEKELFHLAQAKHSEEQAKRKAKRVKLHETKLARREEATALKAAEQKANTDKAALALHEKALAEAQQKAQAEAEIKASSHSTDEDYAQKTEALEARLTPLQKQQTTPTEDDTHILPSDTSQELSPKGHSGDNFSIATTDDDRSDSIGRTPSPVSTHGLFAKSASSTPSSVATPTLLDSKESDSCYAVAANKNKVGFISECDYLKRLTAVQKKIPDQVIVTVLGGGLIRNLQGKLGHKTDIDIFTNASREQIAEVFPISNESDVASINQFSDSFGDLYVIRFKNSRKIEVIRSKYLTETEGSFDDKLLALANNSVDYTFNGFFLNETGELFTPLPTSLADLENRRLMTIGEPSISFQFSPLRILRGIDFAARFGINIATSNPELANAMHQYAHLIVEKELPVKVNMCMQKLLGSGYAVTSYYILMYYGVMQNLLPNFSFYMGQNAGWLHHQLQTADARFLHSKNSINRLYMILVLSSVAQDFQRYAMLPSDVKLCIEQNTLLKANFSGCQHMESLRDELTLKLLEYANYQLTQNAIRLGITIPQQVASAGSHGLFSQPVSIGPASQAAPPPGSQLESSAAMRRHQG
jgi:tRNA nucleotidyltransferase/poly(A) polymerase/tetratricopeptide (TPR) repeat protein